MNKIKDQGFFKNSIALTGSQLNKKGLTGEEIGRIIMWILFFVLAGASLFWLLSKIT